MHCSKFATNSEIQLDLGEFERRLANRPLGYARNHLDFIGFQVLAVASAHPDFTSRFESNRLGKRNVNAKLPLELVGNISLLGVANDMQQLRRGLQQIELHVDRELTITRRRHDETTVGFTAGEAIAVQLNTVRYRSDRQWKWIRIRYIEVQTKSLAGKIEIGHLHVIQAHTGRIDQPICARTARQ